MTHASVFSGIGGPEVAATMLGWENLFHCEINPFGRAVLDYWYPNAKSYEDITTTDFSEWRGKVDVLTGGFPCQPFSYAGQRRGAQDDRYLWPYMFRCIDAVRPRWVVAENVAGILTMVEQGEVSGVETQGALFDEGDAVRRYRLRETFTLQRICDDLEGHGYAVQPVLIPACAVGAPHRRDRVFIVGRRVEAVSEDTLHGRQLHRPNEEQGSERNIGNVGAGGGERLCGETSRTTTADTACGGEGTPGEGGGIESDGSHEDKQPRQWGAASEWNSRFYELLRNAADTDGDRGCEVHQHLEPRQPDGAEPFGNGGERDAADTTEQCRKRMRFEQPETCRAEQEQFGRRGSEDGGVAGYGRWRDFPTVSPVHRGNDGLPFPLDDLTLSPAKWRTEALKAYGNAICPEVMYEIFRAIEIAEAEYRKGTTAK